MHLLFRLRRLTGSILAGLLVLHWGLRLPAQDSPAGIPAIDRLVEQAIAAGEMPGAVVLAGRKDSILHCQAYGDRQILPDREAMTVDTLFDLASLTKPVSTASSILLLIEQDRLTPQTPVADVLPDFQGQGKERITVHHLLTHTSGLIADNSLRDYQAGQAAAWKNICRLTPVAPPGEKFIYSDVGFIVLGMLVEQISGEPLDQFAARHVFLPLGMTDTGYCPPLELRPRIAPTEQIEGAWLRGTVHDPRARALGGVAGHAGVFSTVTDLSRYARMVLNDGELDGVRVLQPDTVRAMQTSQSVPGGGVRTWGWDRRTGFSSNRGEGMTDTAIGHGGFTGTGLWIDPGLDLYVIFLSSRLHPDGQGAVNRLIGAIGTEAVRTLDAR